MTHSFTRHLVIVMFLLAGVVNLVPVVGVLGAEHLASLYGMPFVGEDLVLLMRHRAVLFGLLGALIIAAAFRARLRGLATVAGLTSMPAYLLLALPLSEHGAAIQRVFWIDVAASVLLAAAYLLSRGKT